MVGLKQLYSERKTKDVFLVATGAEINEITPEQWSIINTTDTMGINNLFHHPEFVPRWLHLELKKDGPLCLERLRHLWKSGWNNVGFVFPERRADFIRSFLPKGAMTHTYTPITRGQHPKLNPNEVVDANFDPNGALQKSYDSSMTSIFQILYLMGYERIIVLGATMTNSLYFYSSGDPIYGSIFHLWNKAHEHNDPNKKHNASHIKNFIVDFNKRHMLPKGREILVGHANTALYPELRVWEEQLWNM